MVVAALEAPRKKLLGNLEWVSEQRDAAAIDWRES